MLKNEELTIEENKTPENILSEPEEVISTNTEIAQAPDSVIETQTETEEVIPETKPDQAAIIPEV